jgi:hypothetical protein
VDSPNEFRHQPGDEHGSFEDPTREVGLAAIEAAQGGANLGAYGRRTQTAVISMGIEQSGSMELSNPVSHKPRT